MITTPSPPPTPYYQSTTPTYSIPSISCNNNCMDIAFLVQMRQSNKCGSVRNDGIIILYLGSGAGPWVSIPSLLQDTSHIYWFHLPKTINQGKTKNPDMRSNFHRIVLYCLGLHTQNPGLREVDLEPSPKRETNRTRALVSLYWSSQSLPLKQSPNQTHTNQTRLDPVRSCRTWKKSYQFPKFYAVQHIKTIFPKTTRETSVHDLDYIWGRYTQR